MAVEGLITTNSSAVNVSDVVVEARFSNPYPTSEGNWSYGFLIRYPSTNTFDAVFVRRIGEGVSPTTKWHHYTSSGSFESSLELASGFVSLDTGPRAGNKLLVIAVGEEGWLYVNNSFVTTLDLGVYGNEGDVKVMAGFFANDEAPGTTVRFEEFTVWSPTTGPAPIPTRVPTWTPRPTPTRTPAITLTRTPTPAARFRLEASAIPEGLGSVQAYPATADGFYPGGTVVVLAASCSFGFVLWAGDVPDGVSTRAVSMLVTMDKDRVLTAICASDDAPPATATPVPTPPTVPSGATLVSVDAPAGVRSGTSFIVGIRVDQVTNFDSASYDVVFDNAVLTLVSVAAGTIGGTTIPVTNSPGSASPSRVVQNVPGLAGVTGSGSLITITFNATGADGTSSDIELTNLVLGDNSAQQIQTTFQSDTVVVGTAATATPTRTATPTVQNITGSYTGSVHNSTYDVDANMTLNLVEVGDRLSGEIEVFDPLEGDGPITGEVVDNAVTFSVDFRLSGVPYTIMYVGSALPSGDMAGTYSVIPTGEQGTWRVSE